MVGSDDDQGVWTAHLGGLSDGVGERDCLAERSVGVPGMVAVIDSTGFHVKEEAFG